MKGLNNLTNLSQLTLQGNCIQHIHGIEKLKIWRMDIFRNPIKGSITTLEKYREYIRTVKIRYELEWIEYYMIIAIINSRYMDIYRMFLY